jgi:hypothetical protein
MEHVQAAICIHCESQKVPDRVLIARVHRSTHCLMASATEQFSLVLNSGPLDVAKHD